MGPDFTGKSAAKAPLGDGMVRQAAAVLQSRPYQMHKMEAEAMGQKPMSPEEFLMQQQGG